MTRERSDRELARKLYLDGKNYTQILSEIKASKSTISKWCGDLADIRRQSLKAAKPPKPQKNYVRKQAEPPYSDCWLYEYDAKKADGRYRVQLVNKITAKHYWMSLARYRMSVILGRILSTDEQVGFADWDYTNHADDNLLLLTMLENAKRHAQRRDPTFGQPRSCVMCEEEFIPKRKNNETCSKACKYRLISIINTRG